MNRSAFSGSLQTRSVVGYICQQHDVVCTKMVSTTFWSNCFQQHETFNTDVLDCLIQILKRPQKLQKFVFSRRLRFTTPSEMRFIYTSRLKEAIKVIWSNASGIYLFRGTSKGPGPKDILFSYSEAVRRDALAELKNTQYLPTTKTGKNIPAGTGKVTATAVVINYNERNAHFNRE